MEFAVKSGLVDLDLALNLKLLLPGYALSSTSLALASDPTTLTASILDHDNPQSSILRIHQVSVAFKWAAVIKNPSVPCQRVLEAMGVPRLARSAH